MNNYTLIDIKNMWFFPVFNATYLSIIIAIKTESTL